MILRAAFAHAAQPELASYKILEPSWVFYAGRPIEELPHGNSAEKDVTGPQQITDHLTLHSEGFVIITDRALADIASQLPPQIGVVAETGRFLKDERLLLLGRTQSSAGMATGHPAAENLHRQR